MRAVDNRLDATRARHLADSFHGRDLARDVYLMRDLNQTRARGDGVFERGGALVDDLWRNRNLDQVQLDACALLALSNRRQHTAIVLSGGENLVAGFQVHSEEQSFQRLGSVARDGNLFAITAEQFRQSGANSFRLRLENLPPRVSGPFFLLPDVTHHRVGVESPPRWDAALFSSSEPAPVGKRVLN